MAMDDDEPRRPAARLTPPILDPMGLEELHAYIGELRAEIARAEEEIRRKEARRSAADAFFRKK